MSHSHPPNICYLFNLYKEPLRNSVYNWHNFNYEICIKNLLCQRKMAPEGDPTYHNITLLPIRPLFAYNNRARCFPLSVCLRVFLGETHDVISYWSRIYCTSLRLYWHWVVPQCGLSHIFVTKEGARAIYTWSLGSNIIWQWRRLWSVSSKPLKMLVLEKRFVKGTKFTFWRTLILV